MDQSDTPGPLTSSVDMATFEQVCAERDALDVRVQQWRAWARFVFAEGGATAGLTDAQLQHDVCARYDADVLAARGQAVDAQLVAITLGPILTEMQAESDAIDEEAERSSITSPEYLRRLRLLGLTARHFLREHRTLFPVLVLLAVFCSACGASSPTAPAPVTPTPTPTPVPTPPPVVSLITVSACPDAVPGLDLGFYREIGCNAFDLPLTSVRRWNVAPKVYLRTVDEAGAPIDAVTLDTVQNAMTSVAGAWTAGKVSLAVERGGETREGVSGWITVKWPTAGLTGLCGRSDVGRDGGTIELNTVSTTCGCNASKIRPSAAKHELGHALGYWHTGNADDLMSGLANRTCDQQPSARELAAAAYQYR